MSESPDEPTLDDVFETRETPHPDRRDHGKTPKHISDEEIDRDLAIEREEVAEEEGR